MHGDIGYKFCWLLLSEDQTHDTPIGNESNGAAAGESANFTVILSFQSTCDFHHKFGDVSFILLTLLIIYFTCSYSNISFNLILITLTLFVVLFSFVFVCFFVFVTVDTSCVDATHGSLALKAYQQNLYLEYYY